MVQWGDPALEARLVTIDMYLKFMLLGLFGWEYFQSLDVEYAVIRRRLTLRWSLIPYLLGRLSLFANLVVLTIGQTMVPASFACQPAIISSAVFGTGAMICSSANFMIRTWLIWKNSHFAHILLLLVTLGHWCILASAIISIKATNSGGVCVVYTVQPVMTATMFPYTMGYDFLVFVMSIVGLSKQPSKSTLVGRLRSQGLSYFAVAVVANIPPTVFAFLGYTILVSITGYFSMTASTIVSCRAVKSLLDLRTPPSSHSSHENVERDITLTTRISMNRLPSGVLTNV